ncbi:hypothetical protein D6D12_06395 [Aureobasidium pullulans]|uniref:Uncharacterized protein n=1 Tax=Aureobasidium pullulans TaxID=5580 RepID=A0AB74JQ69_AURPU|nr:hypothetical protein D6D12_06395 [Aureobasidium pullulans]THX45542.1 hypothetical protein D6D11_07322 [Aureobasidium pullulans]THX67661.1 hypothetical protein D6D08_06604 [Aureobasidium pullulans]
MQLTAALLVLSTILMCHQTLASTIQKRSSCSNFTLATYEGLPYLDLRPGPHTHRISKGIDCKNKTEKCPITAGGYVGEKPTLNITTDSPDSIFKLIGHTKNGYNFTSILSDIGTHHYEILIGTSGWVTFTPRESCVTGTLTGCQGDIIDDTVVRACTPYLQDNVIEGKFAWAERVPSEYDLSCNPANTTAAKTFGEATDCESDMKDDKKNVAGSLNDAYLCLIIAAFGLVVFVV